MTKHQYFKINPDAYLFDKQDTPEERIRQWALFELISYFGYNINDITTELPVKVGRRTHYADIVITSDNKPLVVVECKRVEDEKYKDGIEQAISYASAKNISAPFAILTNGNQWLVKRKVKNDWKSIPDIPMNFSKYRISRKISGFLDEMKLVEPLLYWTYSRVPIEKSVRYFHFIQRFLFESQIILSPIDINLVNGAELIFRPLSSGHFEINTEYTKTKFEIAQTFLSKYFESIDANWSSAVFDIHTIQDYINIYFLNINELIMNIKGIDSQENALLRSIHCILRYYQSLQDVPAPICVPESISLEIQNLISPFFENLLGLEFPDRLDEDGLETLKELSSVYWITN